MAHGSQELGLGPVGGLGLVSGEPQGVRLLPQPAVELGHFPRDQLDRLVVVDPELLLLGVGLADELKKNREVRSAIVAFARRGAKLTHQQPMHGLGRNSR